MIGRRSFLAALPALPLVRPADQTPGPGNVFLPGSFGAKGDGRTDDTAALQAGLDAAKTALDRFPTDQARAVVDLAGLEYLVSRPLLWPATQGITLASGVLTAAAGFPPQRYVVELWDEGTQLTRLSTFRDVTFDASRAAGVGCLYLVNHARTTVDNCFFKRMKTFGIRSVNGAGISNELIVSHCRFDEWPLGDGTPAGVDSTALSLEHNDSVVSECVIGIAGVGIDLGGSGNVAAQFNMIRGTHIYTGYRPGGPHVVASEGIHVRSNGVHTCIDGCYVDNCGVTLDAPYDLRVVNSLFLADTADAAFAFIRLVAATSGAGLDGVVIRHNGFTQLGSATVAMLAAQGGGSFAPNASRWRTCDISNNSGNDKVALTRLDRFVPGVRALDHGRVAGSVVLDYEATPNQVLVLGGAITRMEFRDIPIGDYFELTVDTGDGGSDVTFPEDVRWYRGTAPTVTLAAHRIDRFRFYRVNATTLVGEVLGQNA